MNRILQATNFAATKHSQQRRKNAEASPYINHPIEVAFHLSSVGEVIDEDILIAALLHDTIEDTDTSREEIERLFGEAVATLVCECTDDKSLPKMERKRLQIENAPTKSPGAKMIKIADKTCNLRSILADPPKDWPLLRQHEYFVWAEKVVSGLLGHNVALDNEVKRVLSIGLTQLKPAEQGRGANALPRAAHD
jgi:guanosine-3',5'-bis(diphosphate) 3'-pyrophosphohydrolase